MKQRICLLLAAALCLAGCTAAPAAPASQPATADTAEAAPAEESARPVLRELTRCADGQYYVASGIDESGQVFLTTVDLYDGRQRVCCSRPGCAHQDESCWAWMRASTVAQPEWLDVYTDGERLYWVNRTDYGHYGMENNTPQSSVFVTGPEGAAAPPAEWLAGTPNYCGNFLQDNSCMDIRWFTDGETLWAYITSNPPDETTGEQTFAATLVHLAPAPEGSEVPYAAQVVWRQVRDGNTGYVGLLDGQIVVQVQYPGPDTGSLADNYKNSTSELRVLGCDGTLGEPLLTFTNGDWKNTVNGTTILDGHWYRMSLHSADLEAVDLRTGESRTLCTLPGAEDSNSMTPELVYNGRLMVDVSDVAGDTRYVIDTATGDTVTLPATWAKDGAVPRAPVFCQVAGDRCLMMVGTQDRMLTTMGQDGATYTFNSPLSVYAVSDLGAYLDGDQDWQICTLLYPDTIL